MLIHVCTEYVYFYIKAYSMINFPLFFLEGVNNEILNTGI